MKVIDLAAARAERNAPDSNCRSRNSDGEPVFVYSLLYRHNGRRYVVDLWARSRRDAMRHLGALRRTGVIEGQVVAEHV